MKKLIFLLLLLPACISNKKLMESWMGRPESELLIKWGAPDRTTGDAANGHIDIYGKRFYTGTQVVYNVYQFFVDDKKNIYAWHYERSLIPPTQMVIKGY